MSPLSSPWALEDVFFCVFVLLFCLEFETSKILMMVMLVMLVAMMMEVDVFMSLEVTQFLGMVVVILEVDLSMQRIESHGS